MIVILTSHSWSSYTLGSYATGSKGSRLEIPIWVAIAVELGRNNVQVMKICKELVNEHYKEPAAVNGLFDDVTTSVLKALVSDKSESDVEVNIGKLVGK